MPAVYVMATDHGTHSAEKWADMISQMVAPISEEIAEHKILAAKKLQVNIADAMVEHVQTALDTERNHLTTRSDERFAEPHDGEKHVDAAIGAVHYHADKSPWAAQFRDNEAVLRNELARHFDAMQNVERMHHADHNPSDAGDAYKAQYHGTGV